MSKLTFITGSKNKFAEVKELLGDIDQLDINLPEIQELDSQRIIEAKLKEAFKHYSGEFIVEDTSLLLSCLGGFPGPLIKWFRKGIGNEGIVRIVGKLGDNKAVARTIVGYAKDQDCIEFFEGSVQGKIVPERVENGFGWDGIFLPDGAEKTFAEMTKEEKNQISHRALAIAKLKEAIG